METALELLKQLWPIAVIMVVMVIALIIPDKKERK
jgi:preprotein translocase subunit YajC